MGDVVLSALLRALDVCVIECLPTGEHGLAARHSSLRLLTAAPDWLAGSLNSTDDQIPSGALPFVDHFLVEAEAAWHEGPHASTSSEPFVIPGGDEEVLLRALALTQDDRRLLVLQRLSGQADVRPMLQRAREHKLEHEALAQRAAAVHAPAHAIDRDIKALADAGLPADHRDLVNRIVQSSADLQAALAPLPVPPPRRRRLK